MDSTASHGSLITVRRFSCFTSYCSQGNQAVCPLTVSQLRHLYRELVEAFLFDALRTWILHFLIICLVLWWWMLLLQMVKASDSEFSYVPLVCEDRASDCFRRCFFFSSYSWTCKSEAILDTELWIWDHRGSADLLFDPTKGQPVRRKLS